MLRRQLFILPLALAMPLQAVDSASPDRMNGYYFNRPNATLAELDADLQNCARLASKTTVTADGPSIGPFGPLVVAFATALKRGRVASRNAETCMVVRGWREVFLTAEEASSLEARMAKDRSTAMSTIVSAEPVTFGTVGYAWANDYAEPHVTRPEE